MLRIHTPEFYQFLNQLIQPDGIALNQCGIVLDDSICTLIAKDALARTSYQCKRCAELMTDIGKEAQLGFIYFLFPLLLKVID